MLVKNRRTAFAGAIVADCTITQAGHLTTTDIVDRGAVAIAETVLGTGAAAVVGTDNSGTPAGYVHDSYGHLTCTAT